MTNFSWRAIEEIDKSLDDVKELLLPLDAGTWLRMALIVLLAGGLFSGFPPIGPGDFSGTDFENSTFENLDEQPTDVSNKAAAGLIAGIAGVVLILGFVSALFRFVFFRTVMKEEPQIRKYIRRHSKDGFKLMLLRVLMSVVVILSVAIVGAAFITQGITIGVISILVMVPIWFIFYLFSFVVNNYAVPNMVKNSSGLIDSISKGLNVFRNEWKQAGIFLLVKIGIGMAISVAMATIGITLLVALGIPFALILIALFAISEVLGVIGIIAGIIIFFAGSITLAVPFRTFVTQWVFNTYKNFER